MRQTEIEKRFESIEKRLEILELDLESEKLLKIKKITGRPEISKGTIKALIKKEEFTQEVNSSPIESSEETKKEEKDGRERKEKGTERNK